MRSEWDLSCSDTLAWQDWLARKGSNKSLIWRGPSPKSTDLSPLTVNVVLAAHPAWRKGRFPTSELTSRKGDRHTVLHRGLNSVLDLSLICQHAEIWRGQEQASNPVLSSLQLQRSIATFFSLALLYACAALTKGCTVSTHRTQK